MSDPDKPNPIEDLRKGLGLLFRAAKTTIDKLPTGQIEEAVITGAREVGRALENVTHTVEEQFLRKPSARAADEAPRAADETPRAADETPRAADEAPKVNEPAKDGAPGATPGATPTPDDAKKRVG